MSSYLPWLNDAVTDYFAGLSLKAMLLDDTYEFDLTHDFRDDLTAAEVTGTGYTAGGVALTGVTVSADSTAGTVKIDFDDVAFGTIDVTNFTGLAVYVDTGSAATDTLLGVDTFPAVPTDGSDGFTYVVGDGFIVLEVG